MKEKLIVDMDGVLSDIYQQLINYQYKENGILANLKDLEGKTEREVFDNFDNYIHSEGFFVNSNPIKGSVEVLQTLNEKYNLFIVSAAMQFPKSLTEKVQWLKMYFPFITWKQIVLCGTKDIIKGDIMIDDHFMNLDKFSGKTILYTQPHNIKINDHKHQRVNNWFEIKDLVD